MTDNVTGDAMRPQPVPVDLAGIDPRHTEQETPAQRLGTTIAETAAGVRGVHHLGGLAARTLDRAQRQVLGTSNAPGVTVSEEAGTTTVDLDIVAEYPHPIDDVVDEARVQVTHAATQLVDGPVVVNITITGIHGPFDQDPAILDAIDQAGDKARDVKERATEKAGDLKDAASATADDLKTRATDLKATADDKVAEMREQADEKIGELKRQGDGLADRASDTADDLRGRAAGLRDSAADTVTEFAEKADAKVDEFQAKAAAKVDEVDGDHQIDEKLDERLDELDEKADEKLDELDEKADGNLSELDRRAAEEGRQ